MVFIFLTRWPFCDWYFLSTISRLYLFGDGWLSQCPYSQSSYDRNLLTAAFFKKIYTEDILVFLKHQLQKYWNIFNIFLSPQHIIIAMSLTSSNSALTFAKKVLKSFDIYFHRFARIFHTFGILFRWLYSSVLWCFVGIAVLCFTMFCRWHYEVFSCVCVYMIIVKAWCIVYSVRNGRHVASFSTNRSS